MGTPPTPTERGTPGGIKLTQGYQSLITFSEDGDIELYERSVTPPGLDGGEAVDTSTMHNLVYRTMSPRVLKTMTPNACRCGYDPVIYESLLAQINVEQTITVTWPDGTTLAYYGFVQKVDFGELVEGTFPECTVTIIATNQDPTDKSEQAAVLTNVAGT